jgi:hypothetical protein
MLLSQRNTISERTGGYLHIIVPSLVPNEYNSYKISVTDLLKMTSGSVVILSATGNLSIPINDNTLIESVTCEWISGTPKIRIGTTPFGQELLEDYIISDTKIIELMELIKISQNLYYSIQDGSLNIRFDLKTDYYG